METHDQFLVALRRIIRAIDLRSKELMQSTGLTAPQIVILQAISRLEPVTVGDLAAAVNLSQGTATTILNRLETKGLVRKARSVKDRRRVFVSLTAPGRETLHRSPRLLQDHFVRAFTELKEWEQSLILASFQRVAEMMQVQDLDVAPVLDTGSLTDDGSRLKNTPLVDEQGFTPTDPTQH